jgi:hypothetical protein
MADNCAGQNYVDTALLLNERSATMIPQNIIFIFSDMREPIMHSGSDMFALFHFVRNICADSIDFKPILIIAVPFPRAFFVTALFLLDEYFRDGPLDAPASQSKLSKVLDFMECAIDPFSDGEDLVDQCARDEYLGLTQYVHRRRAHFAAIAKPTPCVRKAKPQEMSISVIRAGQRVMIPHSQYLHENRTCLDALCARAVRAGNFPLLQWAHAHGYPWDAYTSLAAVRAGRLDILQWMHERGCPLSMKVDPLSTVNNTMCADAARDGRLDILQLLRNPRPEGAPWNERTCCSAARAGHLEVLKWARANGCPWGERTCASAAQGGHLEILQWLRANGCPWDSDTCANAAHHGHLGVLEWARANGCPWIVCTHIRIVLDPAAVVEPIMIFLGGDDGNDEAEDDMRD